MLQFWVYATFFKVAVLMYLCFITLYVSHAHTAVFIKSLCFRFKPLSTGGKSYKRGLLRTHWVTLFWAELLFSRTWLHHVTSWVVTLSKEQTDVSPSEEDAVRAFAELFRYSSFLLGCRPCSDEACLFPEPRTSSRTSWRDQLSHHLPIASCKSSDYEQCRTEDSARKQARPKDRTSS